MDSRGFHVDATMAAVCVFVGDALPSEGLIRLQITVTEALNNVVLHGGLPQGAGIDMTVRKAAPEAALLIVSSLTSPAIVSAAIEFGASGYVPKHSQRQVFQDALACLARGEVYLPQGFAAADPAAARPMALTRDRLDSLTGQQSRILALISEGKLNKQIAHDLDIAESTVKAHVTVIMRKLGVQTRTQAVLAAQAARFDSLAAR